MRFVGLILYSLLLAILLAANVTAQVSQLEQKAPQANELLSAARAEGHVSVIVEFAPPAAAGQIAPDQDLAPLKAQIAAAQEAIISSHFGSANDAKPGQGFPRALQRLEITPMFGVNVTLPELEALAGDPRVIRLHPNALERAQLNVSVPLIGMTGVEGAYARGGTGSGGAVAILDTGVQSNHAFLAGKVVMEACFSNSAGGGISLCPNGSTSQSGTGAASPLTAQCLNGGTNLCRHGTHVAGIAAGNNTSLSGGGPANGVAKDAKIVAVQVFSRFNNPADCGPDDPAPCVRTYTLDQIRGLDWIYQNALHPAGVTLHAVNMSLGGGSTPGTCDTDSRKGPIDNLLTAGVATVISSGNDYNDRHVNATSMPGCISTAVTVGSTTDTDVISSFSNISNVVDLLAPGGGTPGSDIYSSIATTGNIQAYENLPGTSMAAPHVAGAIAAIRSTCLKTIDEILTALKSTGLNVTDNRPGGAITKPRIRVGLAMQQLNCGTPPPPNDNFANATAISLGQTLSGLNINATKEAGEPNHAGRPGGRSVWWKYQGASSGTVEIKTAGSQFNTVLGVYTGSAVNALTLVAQHDDVVPLTDQTSRVVFAASAGTTYWIAVDGYNASSQGFVQISLLPASMAASHDFDGNSKSDIAWRSTSGIAAAWLMNGSAVAVAGSLGAAPSEWQIVGQRDFNGDFKDDLLWRHSSGANSIWFLNGAALFYAATLTGVGPDWQVVGTGDFNGDGKGDILWRQNTGLLSVWLMNGVTISLSQQLGGAPPVWQVAGIGDFDGDGKSDILFRHVNGATAIWYMYGTAIASASNPPGADTSWAVVGTGDFNGDGKSDILWRQAGGTLAIWLMNGSTPISSTPLGGAPPVWQVTKTGDFNGDGKSDILFRHSSGANAIWYMNGAALASASYPPGVGTEWAVQSRNAD